MSTDTTLSPWTTAEQHCWSHIETATAVQKVIHRLSKLDIDSVTPIISSISPTLLIVPQHSDEIDSCRNFARDVKELLETDSPWIPVQLGDNWALRLTYGSIVVQVCTSIAVSKPTEFKI